MPIHGLRHRTSVLAVALLGATAAIAQDVKNEPTAAITAALGLSVPDVAHWQQVAPGFVEGKGRDGELTRVYAGDEGRRLYLSTLRDHWQRSQELLRATDPEVAKNARNTADFLKASIARLEAANSTRRQGNATRATQEPFSYSAQVCAGIYGLPSRFTANIAMVDAPQAEARMGAPGPGFGPYPPPPSWIVRAVSATVNDLTSTAVAYDTLSPITASRSVLTFPGSCTMNTRHEISWRCGAMDPQFFALTRTQTCAGVLNGTPPQ
ncbi:hypothetical protein [Tahibacter amnicola]|uniref:Uncharacterized protein n=1 Tax=Tahibacter amnicola TaxID=2976241 RepID=A0ABY6BJ87_9GAMM|nr:hypothetical protein [Tahibacter amnicola]UXI70084.1 hypothetical protein N4264_10785 [Tahibacter amnicola]